jgi:hypothetical protein
MVVMAPGSHLLPRSFKNLLRSANTSNLYSREWCYRAAVFELWILSYLDVRAVSGSNCRESNSGISRLNRQGVRSQEVECARAIHLDIAMEKGREGSACSTHNTVA